jgi:YhhN-like protein
MLWRAAARVGSPADDPRAARLGLLGALLFAASDSLIALDRFHAPLGAAGHAILPLYWLGQLGIALSAAPPAPAALVSSPAEDE